jgi:hypothetical protein
MVRVKSSQKFFTAEEVASLTGICPEHLRSFAHDKHLGFQKVDDASRQLFTSTDLMIVAVLQPRCEH